MSWALIRELGIRCGSARDEQSGEVLLAPSFVEQAADGTCLIVDELGIEKAVPFRFECRTIRVRRDGSIIYDTLSAGFTDGCGCLMADGHTAILRRTAWEILIVSAKGEICERIGLGTCSKRMPRFLSWTHRETFLIVFLDRSGNLDVVEIDRRGRLLWYLPSSGFNLGVPKSLQLLPSGNILIADEFRHVSVELDRRGQVVWQFGEVGNPSDRPDRLSNPRSARRLSDGTHLFADTRNHRVLAIRSDGEASVRYVQGGLCDPSYVDALPNGNCLICDTGNARVIEVTESGEIVWEYGNRKASSRSFSYPRSVELSQEGAYVVADTAGNRVVRIRDDSVDEWPIDDEKALFWPRCARILSTGSVLIADARHSRILEVSARGTVLNKLCHDRVTAPHTLHDPHDVWLLDTGRLLITDSSGDVVIEADWGGRVFRSIGREDKVQLKDPHSAQALNDGTIIICDTGNNRIVFVDEAGDIVKEIEAIHGDAGWMRLYGPRYAEVGDDRCLVIADTGNNRVLACTVDGEFVWELSRIPESSIPLLHQPRWAHLRSRDEVIVSDHFNHRIVHVRRSRPNHDHPEDR